MSDITINSSKFKATVKEIILEIFRENREEFSEVFAELIEDIALSKAIEEGESTEYVDRESIFKLLDRER